MNEEKLAQYLKLCCKGRANTKRSDEIERAAGLSGNELRKLVNRMRRRGVPIGSSRSGYFYAVTAGEVYSTIRQLRRMADGLEASIAGLDFRTALVISTVSAWVVWLLFFAAAAAAIRRCRKT